MDYLQTQGILMLWKFQEEMQESPVLEEEIFDGLQPVLESVVPVQD